MQDDLITDILARILALCSPRTAERLDLAKVEAEVRRDWGGERHYVAKEGEDARARLAARDQRIRDQARKGEHVPLLARRHRLSERRIQQILRSG